jgi:hypothetical protein
VHNHPGNIFVKLGDTLMIDASPEFHYRYENNYTTFSLLSEAHNLSPPRPQYPMLLAMDLDNDW